MPFRNAGDATASPGKNVTRQRHGVTFIPQSVVCVRGSNNEMKTKELAMQTNRQAQRPNRVGALWHFRRRALMALAAFVLITAPLGHSARAQGAPSAPPTPAPPTQSATPSSAAAPPVQSPAPSVQPSASPSTTTSPASLPAAAGTQPNPQAGSAAPNNQPATTAPASPGEPSIGGEMLPQKLSFERMFLDADSVVKTVMITLALASFVTWTVFVAKTLELRRARSQIRRGLRTLLNAATLAQAHEQFRDDSSAAAQLMEAAAQEIRLSANAGGDGLKERIALQLERLEMAISRKISRGTGVLATIGSTAVFVGLFGTVWGIMNSFIGISNAHTTNLAVVAPGIAQALLATATGLIAAIPAVVIYNVLTRQTAHYRALLGDASAQIIRLVSRDLDRARLPLAQAAE
jgi:biopolymer transport protein ExbB